MSEQRCQDEALFRRKAEIDLNAEKRQMQKVLSHLIDTPYQHILSIRHINPPYPHLLSLNPLSVTITTLPPLHCHYTLLNNNYYYTPNPPSSPLLYPSTPNPPSSLPLLPYHPDIERCLSAIEELSRRCGRSCTHSKPHVQVQGNEIKVILALILTLILVLSNIKSLTVAVALGFNASIISRQKYAVCHIMSYHQVTHIVSSCFFLPYSQILPLSIVSVICNDDDHVTSWT